jgi:cell division protein FtsL
MICAVYWILRVHTCRQSVNLYESLALSHLLHGSPQEWPRTELEQSTLLECTRRGALARAQLQIHHLDNAQIIRLPLVVLLQLDKRPTYSKSGTSQKISRQARRITVTLIELLPNLRGYQGVNTSRPSTRADSQGDGRSGYCEVQQKWL